jgi:hypothetical protein
MAPRYTPSPSSLPKITSYNGVATAGAGVSPIRAYGSVLGTSTTLSTVTSYTVGAANGVFEVGGIVLVTVWTSGVVQLQVNFTDCQGNARSYGMTGETSAGGSAGNISATGSFGGTATADFYAFIRQVN